MEKRTIVYVDGFNLYYGSLRHTTYKWLNVLKLCELLLPKHEIVGVKYFTSRISYTPGSKDKMNRQQVYLRALKTIPNLNIVFGQFRSDRRWLPLVEGWPQNPNWVRVVLTKEKGSDVNMASHFLYDSLLGKCNFPVVITNDSDITETLKLAKGSKRRVSIGVINPQKNQRTNTRILRYATFTKKIRAGVLKASQFPEKIYDSDGEIRRPGEWSP